MGVDVNTGAGIVSSRDYRIDFIRGLALLTIFINHVRGNFFENLTHKNFGLSDAAEIFMLLAGVSAALAFYPKFVPGRYQEVNRKVGERVWKLYIWHIGTSLIALSLFVLAGVLFSNPALFKEINIWPVVKNPAEGILGLFTLGHQLGYFNILPMYMILMVMLPLIMLLYRKSIWLLVSASILLYLIAGYFRLAPPNYPNEGMWFFNPFSWQLIYVCGFAGYLYAREHGGIPYNRFVFWGSVAMLVWWLLWIQLEWWGLWSYVTLGGAAGALWGFDKTFVSLPRLLHLLALVYVFIHSPLPRFLEKMIGPENAVVRIGKNALHLFCFGSVLSMFLLIVRIQVGGSLLLDIVLVSSGIAGHVLLANYLSKSSKPVSNGGPFIIGGVGPTAVT